MSLKTDSPMSGTVQLAASPVEGDVARITTAKGPAALGAGPGPSIVLAAVLALAAVVLCHGLTEPFIGHHDWTSASMSAAARNHLRYGYSATRLAIIENNDFVSSEWFRYYTNHPPLVPLFVSLSFRLFGEHEWAARLVPIIFSLGSTVLVYLLGTRLGGYHLGLLSAFVYALLPMNAYFGRMVCTESPTNFFALATALAYLRWHRTHRPWPFILVLVALGVGAFCDWPGYYLAGILPLHHLVASRDGHREWKILFLPLTALIVFGLHLGHIFWLKGSDGLSYLASMFFWRTNLYVSPILEVLGVKDQGFNWTNFLALEVERANALFTPLVLILAALSLYDLVRRRGGAVLPDSLFIVVLLIFGATHLLLFSQAAWEHDYWLFYCSAALSVLAANGALSLAGPAADRRLLGFLGVLFVLAILPRIQSLYSHGDPRISPLAVQLQEYTRPGEQILTNAPVIYNQAPQLGYYAGRDVSYNPVFRIPELEHTFAANARRRFAFLLLEGEHGEAELAPWLSSRYPSDRADFLGKPYLIFHIDQDHSVSMERRESSR
jgi:4-amino-4-deoxy-L-arabinose transferase-like glycosyltransferase